MSRALDGLRALVLGGTGLIGSHVVRSLIRRGVRVRVLSRTGAPGPSLEGVDVEMVRGSLEHPASVETALDGCDLLFHAAAPYPTRHFGMQGHVDRAVAGMEALLDVARSRVPPELLAYPLRRAEQVALEQAEMGAKIARVQPERLEEIRRAVRDPELLSLAEAGRLNASLHPPLEACRPLAGLKRIVYTSSLTTIGRARGTEPGSPRRRDSREEDFYDLAPDPSPYFACKRLLETIALRAANEGLPLVVVNPTLVVGEGDSHGTTARLILPVARGRVPFYLAGAIQAVAAGDVGEGEVRAAAFGRTGQRYILGGDAIGGRRFLSMIAQAAGRRGPWIPLPWWIVEPFAYATEVIARLRGDVWPALPVHGIKMLREAPLVDPSRSRTELGAPHTPVQEAIRRAVEWFRERGTLPRPRGR
ncbi:MAG: NAD-dependent epimerase/dehydratase family protein [Candidatus Eisenbacteria bacterium]